MLKKILWKLLRILPLGLRLKIGSKFDDRINRLFSFYGQSLKKNTNWKGDVDWLNAIVEEKDEKCKKKLTDVCIKILKEKRKTC